MKFFELLRKLQGKITGINVLSARFDFLQVKMESLTNTINELNKSSQELPLIVNESLHPLIDSYSASIQHIQNNFATFQLQLDNIETIVEQLNQNFKLPPSISDSLLDARSDSHNAPASFLNATADFSNSSESALIEILPSEKIRLLFLVITPEIWPSLESVWKLAKNDNRFSVSIVVLRSANAEIALTSLTKAQATLDNLGISYFTEHNFSLESHRPHVVFYPLPYGSLYPKAYKPDVVSAMGCRITYVSYGLEVGGGVFNSRYQYDSDVPRVAWRIFARSVGQLSNFGRYCSRGNGHVVVTGHPRLERSKNRKLQSYHPAKLKARGRLVILWTPHFSVLTRRKWSSFLDHQESILKLIGNRSDLFLLVRPHPFLRISLAKLEGWSFERVDEWFNMINKRDDTFLDTDTNYFASFEISTALMADAGSFLVEYLLTAKPICHLSGSDDIGLSEEARSLSCYYPGTSEIEIADFLDTVSNGDDNLSAARKSALDAYFGPNNKSPSQTILDVVAKDIANQSQSHYLTQLSIPSHQKQAFKYWLNLTGSFTAPASSPQDQKIKFRGLLNRHASGRFAVDIGCGNGQLTQILGEYFEYVEGVDLNEVLISEARENSLQKGIKNIAYSIDSLEHADNLSSYDFVSCMDATSDLIDDERFIKFIWKLKTAMRPGAKLLMKDYLNLSTQESVECDGNNAVYRNLRAYIGAFEAAGLSLVEELPIAQDKVNCRVSSFFIFKDRTSNEIKQYSGSSFKTETLKEVI